MFSFLGFQFNNKDYQYATNNPLFQFEKFRFCIKLEERFLQEDL